MAESDIRRIPRVESVSELGMSMPTDLPSGLSLLELKKMYPLPDEPAEEKKAETAYNDENYSVIPAEDGGLIGLTAQDVEINRKVEAFLEKLRKEEQEKLTNEEEIRQQYLERWEEHQQEIKMLESKQLDRRFPKLVRWTVDHMWEEKEDTCAVLTDCFIKNPEDIVDIAGQTMFYYYRKIGGSDFSDLFDMDQCLLALCLVTWASYKSSPILNVDRDLARAILYNFVSEYSELNTIESEELLDAYNTWLNNMQIKEEDFLF